MKKNDIQKVLFDGIRAKLPPRYALVDTVSELLDISADAAYRRLRGDKIMDIEEVAILCKRFGISLDALLNIPGIVSGSEAYSYTPLDLGAENVYYLYMQGLADRMEQLCMAPGAEIISSALDVPFFHFLPYKELTFFKLFAWTNSVYSSEGNFEEFARKTENRQLLDCYGKIVANHRLIPSREIWTKNTTETFLKLVHYHFEMGHFSTPDVPLILCDQFLQLLDTLQGWTEKGNKGETEHIPFQLYLSEVDMENSFILLKEATRTNCILKLFTINSLYVTDRQFCSETENWLDHLARRSTLISGASEKERHKFFTSQRQKVRFLIDRISNQQ